MAFILLFLHHNSQSLLIIFLCWTQHLDYWSHDTNYMFMKLYWFLGYFCPCRDFLSIIQLWICCVWTVSFLGVGIDHLITHIQDVHNIAGPLVPYTHAGPKRGLIHWDRESSVIRPLLNLQATMAGYDCACKNDF